MHITGLDALALSAKQGYPYAAYRLRVLRSPRLGPQGKDDLAACTWFEVAAAIDPAPWLAARSEEIAELRKELPGRLRSVHERLGTEKSAECTRRASAWGAANRPAR